MLTITLLGTAATMPLPERALTAAVAECGGFPTMQAPTLVCGSLLRMAESFAIPIKYWSHER